MTPRGTLAVAHDPGGANAVAATVRVLRERGRPVTALVQGPARAQFERLGVACDDAGSDAPDTREFGLVLVGTSSVAMLDRNAIANAREHGVPSVALIDYWVNYRRRFTQPDTPDGEFTFLPDHLVAIDDVCRDGMHDAGLPSGRIRVLGQPYFAWLLRLASVRGVQDALSGVRVLFASEPGPLAEAALERLAAALPPAATLLVRLHPREAGREGLLADLRARGVAVELDESRDPLATARRCTAVVGLTTTLLVEASLAGVPTGTLTPALQPRLVELGLAVPLDTRPALEAFLDTPRATVAAREFVDGQRSADERCAELCSEIERQSAG